MEALLVEKITVKNGRMVLAVRVQDGFPLYTTPAIAAAALKVRPTLANHACVNSKGPTFAAVIEHTSVAHLFEHLIIDEQVRISSQRASSAPSPLPQHAPSPLPQHSSSAPASANSPSAPSATVATLTPSAPSAPAATLTPSASLTTAATATPSTPSTFTGTTRWLDKKAKTACVQVSFQDDLVALEAIKSAAQLLSEILEKHFS